MVRKRFWRLLLLLVICAGSGFGLYTYLRRSDERAKARLQAQKLFSLPGSEAIQTVTLHGPNGTFVLSRQGDDNDPWVLESPRRTPADSSAVQALLKAVLEAQSLGRVGAGPGDDPNTQAARPADLSLFGLSPPVYLLTLAGKSGDKFFSDTVTFGKKNSFDGSLYAKRQRDDDVVWVDGGLAFELDQDLYKLRDKRPMPLRTEQVTGLEVSDAHGLRFALARQDKHFVLRLPQAAPAPADAAQVDTLLSALAGMRAKQIANEGTTDPTIRKRFGLDAPRYTVRVQQGTQPVAVLQIATRTLDASERTFVQRVGDYPVLELGSDWVCKKLSVPPSDLRDVRLLPVDVPSVARIDIAQGDQTLTLLRTDQDKDTWVVGPNKKPADVVKLNALLYKLTSLKPEGKTVYDPSAQALSAAGLDAGARRVTLRDATGQTLGGLRLGKEVDDKVQVAPEPPKLFTQADKSALREVTTDAKNFLPDDGAAPQGK